MPGLPQQGLRTAPLGTDADHPPAVGHREACGAEFLTPAEAPVFRKGASGAGAQQDRGRRPGPGPGPGPRRVRAKRAERRSCDRPEASSVEAVLAVAGHGGAGGILGDPAVADGAVGFAVELGRVLPADPEKPSEAIGRHASVISGENNGVSLGLGEVDIASGQDRFDPAAVQAVGDVGTQWPAFFLGEASPDAVGVARFQSGVEAGAGDGAVGAQCLGCGNPAGLSFPRCVGGAD